MNSHFASFPARLLRTFLLRGATLWLLARLMGSAALAAVSTTGAGSLLFPVWVVVMTASLTLVDLHRRREVALLHNLGITTVQTVVIATVPSIIFESLLVMILP